MDATNNTRTEAELAREYQGWHWRDAEWRQAAETAHGGWNNLYPEVDRHGNLTGRVVGADEDGGCWLSVECEAVISLDEARKGGWRVDAENGEAEESENVAVEFALQNETIRDAIGVPLGCACPEEACAAYRLAAITALECDSRANRMVAVPPRGARSLHSQWCGVNWGAIYGAVATMARDLTPDELDAISAADDAGRAAAAAVIAEDERATAGE